MSAHRRNLCFFLLVSCFFTAYGEECVEVPIECSGDGEIDPDAQQAPIAEYLDVVFVIDGSTSIGEKSFVLGKNFVADFVSDFVVGPGMSRVGVVTYGTNVTINMELGESADLGGDETVSKIKGIQQPGGGTRTGQGVKAMTSLFVKQGRLAEEIVKSMAFILTDGRSQQPPGENAKEARDLGITLYAIGIGEEINRDELISIAGTEERVYLIANYEQLVDIKAEVFPKPMRPPIPKSAGVRCVQLECMLDDEGVPTMRVLVPDKLQSCCRGAIGSCPNMKFEESQKSGFMQCDVKAGECNTNFNVAEKDLEYSNILNLYEESDDGLVIRDETEWRLKCTYPREDLRTAMIDSSRKVANVTNSGFIPTQLEVFDAAFANLMPKPPIYGLKERVFVQASMPTHEELELFPLNCWTTQTADPGSAVRKELIVNGCDEEASLQREPDNRAVQSRFSFEAFRFHGESCKVFIHCDLLICAADDPSSRCSQGCVRRRRRSLGGTYLSSQSVTAGPIVIGDPNEAKATFVDGVNRMERLRAVGEQLDRMMFDIRRGRFRF